MGFVTVYKVYLSSFGICDSQKNKINNRKVHLAFGPKIYVGF